MSIKSTLSGTRGRRGAAELNPVGPETMRHIAIRDDSAGPLIYSAAMSQSRTTAANRAAGSCSYRPAAASRYAAPTTGLRS